MHLILLALAIAGPAAQPTGATTPAPFELSIVPSESYANSKSIVIARTDAETFYVVLTNVSGRPQPVFRTSNSWGYRLISFEIDFGRGDIRKLTRWNQGFTRNIPSTYFVPPAGHQVFPIQIDHTWNRFPVFDEPGTIAATIKAIYEVTPSTAAEERGVWVGTITSTPEQFLIEHR